MLVKQKKLNVNTDLGSDSNLNTSGISKKTGSFFRRTSKDIKNKNFVVPNIKALLKDHISPHSALSMKLSVLSGLEE